MKLVCPCCGATLSIEALLTDGAAREAVAAALALPAPLGDRVLRYLALFRPASRALSWDRAAKLLHELLGPIKAAQVERNGRAWAAPLAAWEQALDQMLANRETLRLPLKGHGYLFEVVAGLANSAEDRAEARRQQARQRPDGRRAGGLRKAIDRQAAKERIREAKQAMRGEACISTSNTETG